MAVKLIVDSTFDITPQVRARVDVVPLTIHSGEQEYIDGITIDSKAFYEKLVESDMLPTTSQATPFVFEEAFRKAVEEGFEVVCLTCASKLSGTHQSAVIAAEEFGGKVHVVDSQSIAIGGGILAEYALTLLDKGMSAEEITWKLLRKRAAVRVLALLDTLGGRIAAPAASAGGILNIKPVITITGGEIQMLGKARGSRQGNNLLVQEIQKAGGVDFGKPVLLGYTGISDSLLRKYISDSAQLWQDHVDRLNVETVGSVVGTHAGPGAVAVAFFASEK